MKKKQVKKQPSKSKKETPANKTRGFSKKEKALKAKRNAQARRNNIKKKVFDLLQLNPDKEIKSYYFVKKGNKKIRLTTKNKPNFFINNLLNQATSESGLIEKVTKKYGRKIKPKKPTELKNQLKLTFSPWQRKNIIDEITNKKSVKAVNASTGENFNLKDNFAAFVIDITGDLTNLASAEGMALFFDFKNKTVTFKKDFTDLESEDIEE